MKTLSKKAAWLAIAAAFQLKVEDKSSSESANLAEYGLCNALGVLSSGDQVTRDTYRAMDSELDAHLSDNDPSDIHSYIAGSDIDSVAGQQDRATFALLLSEASR